MTELINCPSCGAVISSEDTECSICGTTLGDGLYKRSLRDLPPPVEDTDDTPIVAVEPQLPTPSKPPPVPSGARPKLPRPSQPPMAIPRPSDHPSPPRGDNTKRVPFSRNRVSSSPPPPPPPPMDNPLDQPSDKQTLLMTPSPFAAQKDEQIKLPTPSRPPPPLEEGGEVKLPRPSKPPAQSQNFNKTLLGVPVDPMHAKMGEELDEREATKEPSPPKPMPEEKKPPKSHEPSDSTEREELPGKSSRVPIVVGASAVAVLAVAAVVFFLFFKKSEPDAGKDSAQAGTDATQEQEELVAQKETPEASGTEAQGEKATDGADEPTGEAKSDTEATDEEKEVDEEVVERAIVSDAKCTPLSEYPKFPWKGRLAGLLEKLELGGVCQLFGTLSAEAVKAGFSNVVSAGPFDDDLRKGVSRVQVFPLNDASESASHMEFLFYKGSLFEIGFVYREDLEKNLSRKAFKKTLGSSGRAKKDRLGRWYSRYKDGDMVVIQAEKKENKARLKWVEFTDPKVAKEVKALENMKTLSAEKAYVEGLEQSSKRKFNRALKSFRDARKEKVNYGMAYAEEAQVLMREEKFKAGKKAAEQALENGSDQRAHAMAHALLAVAALYAGDKEEAIRHYRQAESTFPGNTDYSASVEELETGKYSDERVAKTAARMTCLGTVDTKNWTKKGLLARGNFTDLKTYKKALTKASKSKEFKKAKRKWQRLECR